MATLVDYDSAIYAIASACDNATWNYRGRSWESKAIAIKALEAEGKNSKELVRVTNPEPWDKVKYTLEKYTDDFINSLEDMFDVTILVSGGNGNFRYEVATIFPYKANRLQELPYHFHAIKDYIVENYDAKRVYHVEVDDALGTAVPGGRLRNDRVPDRHPVLRVDRDQVGIQRGEKERVARSSHAAGLCR